MARSLWGRTPRQSIEAACAEHGRDAVVLACADLLAGREVDAAMLRSLGGPRADRHAHTEWARVWGARGLLWAWDDRALAALRAALDDPAWRVREMAAKVVARHLLGDALPLVAGLTQDPVPRVRTAAARAVAQVTAAGA